MQVPWLVSGVVHAGTLASVRNGACRYPGQCQEWCMQVPWPVSEVVHAGTLASVRSGACRYPG